MFVLVVLAWYDWKLVCGMLLLGLVYYILTFFLFRKKSKSIAAMEVELSG